MNSPCIVVSQYKLPDRPTSLPNGGCSPSSTGWAPWLLNSECPRRSSNPSPLSSSKALPSEDRVHQDYFTEQDIPRIMDGYRDLMFDFTFPEAVDFRDLRSGQLAATHRSTMVAEHGWKLWELAEILKRIPTTSDNSAILAKHIRKIEASMDEVRLWVEDQRAQQLFEEADQPGGPANFM